MFIEEAFQKGIDLWVSEGKLRYRAPKGAFTPELKEKLGQQKDKILSLVTPPYVAEEESTIFLYPLSYAQKTFWFLYQLAPASAAYNMPFAVRICSRLDIAAFQKTLQALIGRHHSFRTTYTAIEGTPVQLLHEHYPLSCEMIDAATWSQEELHKRLHDEARRPFDLEQGPVLRAQLFSLSGNDHIFLITVHHIALDLWSLEVIIDELGKLYAAQITGTQPSLPPLEFQYKDFVRWQLQMLAGPRGDQLRVFWQEQLTGELPVLNLPTDRARPAVQTYNTGIVPFMSGKEFSQQVKAFAGAEKVSLYSVLLAAFFVLLHRYTAQDDILVGAPTSGRSKTEFQHIAGYFVNPIVLRANLEGNPSCREFLQKVQQIVLRGFDHQDYPSHLLPEELHLNHDPGHPQLFQTIFMFQELHRLRQASSLMTGKPGQPVAIGGLAMEPVDVGEETIIFVDLLLMMYEEDEQIASSWQYNSDLFDAETIERMAEHFKTSLKGMLANPEIPISELPLLTEAERHTLLVEWTGTKIEYPDDACIHHKFEQQAARTPEATALVFTSLESGARIALTYQELNQKANQLAHYLRSLNVGAEILVGVCMERSIDMVIALLGILKAGGAYLPLDPAYPADRLQYMFEDSQIPVLLTQQQLLERLPAHSAHTICLDTEWEKIAGHGTENSEPQTVVDNLAYMIYTSGSTGKPKGVMLSHRGLLNLCEVQKRAFRKTPESRVLQFASLSFDASVSEVFVTFLAGATLHIAPQNDLMPGPPLSQTLRQNKISVVTLPPSVLSAMEQEEFPDLKTIVSAGEACSVELVKRWQPGRVFLNAYGPTEGTVCATINEQITPETASSIGKTIANTQIYILDRYLNPVPVGVPGELCFGGISLARGYRNRPELTAEKFIPHPFSDEPGARLYRTGDLARYLLDGNLEFLGRIDHQLKVRGYRIESGEIEAILESHPGVLDSVVVARKNVAGEKQLTAYVIPDLNALQAHSNKLLADQITKWQSSFETVHGQPSALEDPTFNIAGWNSSYTGKPIPEEEMREWVKTTVEQILSFSPNRVLEIGCGTGLLLFRVAPHCKEYLGTDFSAASLDFVRKTLAALGEKFSHTTVLQNTADNFDKLPSEDFDMVILNSVIQYFPGLDYLLQVLEGVLQIIRKQGVLFLGDIRSLPLLEAYHTSVQLYQAPASLTIAQLNQRIKKQLIMENELVISPEFFVALKQRFPQIKQVQISPRRGHYKNEMTCFRYNVVLHINTDVVPLQKVRWMNWHKDTLTLNSLRQLFTKEACDLLGITNIPNRRVLKDVTAVTWLNENREIATVGELREMLQNIPSSEEGIEPEDLRKLGEEFSYTVDISWARSYIDGSYDVLFRRQEEAISTPIVPAFPETKVWFQALKTYTNNPLQGQGFRSLAPQLKEFLQKQLPEYMVPSFFVLLDKFPLTPNGKVDRRALPEPEKVRPEISQVFEAPRTPVEERLADIWSEILGVEQIGIHDDFFNLGGNSLVVIQLVSRLRDTFQIEIPLFKLFEVRTIEDLALVVEELLASGTIQPVTETQVIHRRPEEGPYPLSFAQQRLWFFDQIEPGSAVYNLYSVTRITGSLDVSALEQSVNEIIRRHASLRTKFEAIDGQPVQIIVPHLTIALPVKDLQHIVKEEQEATIHHVALEETQKPFNLSECPLFRAVLLKLAPQEHVIITTTHHIISDDWSGGVFMLELAALYAAFSAGQSSPLPELPVQYTDFALWQREFLQGEVLARQLFYWKQQLSGDSKDLQGSGKPFGAGLPVLQLPTDRPRLAKRTFPGKTQSFALSKRLSDLLKNLSQQEGSTLFMTLFAGFNTLLYRYTGQEDIIIGTPFANRNRTEIENLIGFFVNTIVLRIDLSGNPSFRELLRQVKEVTLEAQANQDIPFDKIVAEVHPDRELNRQPLFQIMFVLQNAPMRDIQLSGLTMTPIEIHNDTSMFDLTLEMVDLDTGLSGIIEYNTDLFDAATIRRMIEHFQVLLEGIAANPEQHIAELPVMQTAEQNQILVEWNDTEAAYPQDVCIHELFEAQVNKTPDALAVVFEKRQFTYRNLNRRANQLAHYLRKLGVTPETPVGICVSRSLEMIAGILGILKAGGAYVPIDPSYPRERKNFIIADAHVSVLVSQQDHREEFPGDGLHIVCLDTDWHTFAQESHRNPYNPAFSENPGYVIYTSGSTGIPKGVIVSHRALVNRSTAIVKRYALQPDERVLQFASISFDVSLEEIFPSLISGATLVLRPGEAAMSFSDLLAFLHQEKVSVANLPTSYWHEWVAELSRSKISLPAVLRLVIVGTEQALLERLVQWRALVGDRIRWINGYGPTEATITATMYESQGKQRLTSIPIGLPIENTQVYLLDKYLQPVPIGVSGELYIGGESLARGYFQRAELTAEKFVPNPFSRAPGGRLYRTGDLARFLPDGNIEFLGRVDHQVKIRGFRIELGEIEVRLKQHPAVREAVVTVREESPGNKRLIAYCIFQQEHPATVNELRDFLKNQLPEYMLPAMFIILKELPLTPSGKIDRRALPEPDAERFGFSPETFVAPRTRNEKILADIWAELLGLQQVGVHDNFFELGGDSILSLQIIARAHQAGLHIKPEQLFQYQTIAELAVAAETTTTIQAEQDMVTGFVPLTPIQFWFFGQELPEPYHWNQSLLLEVHRELDPELLEKAFQHLIRHHDALRLRFIREENGWNQECSALHEIPLVSQIDVASLPEAEQRKAIEEKSATFQRSLNISEGPLLRAALFQRGSVKPNCLFLVIHHLAVDGVSWRIVLEDLQTAYAQLLEGREMQLPLKTTSFKSWAERLTEYAGITRLQDEIPYWTDESRSQIVSLPRDYSEGSNTEASAQTVSYALNAEETRQLLNEVPQAYNTQINDVLLTALARSVSIWSGAQSVLIELEGHGREPLFEDVDLSRTVGWFTTAFPVLLDIGEVFSSGEALKSIKEQLRCIPNRGIGYGILRYLSRDPAIRSMLAALPQPEISFNYLGRLDQILSESKFFTLAEENRGPEHSPLGKRGHLLEVNGFVMAGNLEVHWTYSENMYQRATIERVAREFMNALRSLIQHCVSPEAGGYTPSDFSDVDLDQDDLDQILAEVSDIED